MWGTLFEKSVPHTPCKNFQTNVLVFVRCGFGIGAGGSALSVNAHLSQPFSERRPVRI